MNSVLAGLGFFGPPNYIFWVILLVLILVSIGYVVFGKEEEQGEEGSGEATEAPSMEPEEAPSPVKPVEKKAIASPDAKTEPVPLRALSRIQASRPEFLEGTRVDEKLGPVFDEEPSEIDELDKIRGIGPVILRKLHSLGVYRFAQIANWDEKRAEEFSERLAFRGRVQREDWIEQARKLHEAKYGKTS